MRDVEQYRNYPGLQWFYAHLESEETHKQRRADTIICKLNFYIKRLHKSNLNREIKGLMYLLLRREFQRRLGECTVLSQDDQNSVNGYIIARTKEMRKNIAGKTEKKHTWESPHNAAVPRTKEMIDRLLRNRRANR